MWSDNSCSSENIIALACTIVKLDKSDRLELIADVYSPGLLEFVSIEILERAKDTKLSPFLAIEIDDELTDRIDLLRGRQVSKRRKRQKV